MKKLSFFFTAMMAWQVQAASAQAFFHCDFESGMPATITLVDGDGLTPSTSMQKMGFEVGTPWIVTQPKDEPDNNVACSTSWYKPAGQSDDWMILPAVDIASDKAVLRWRAMAVDAKHRDGYVVYVATTTQPTTADWQPLLTVEAEEASWQQHSVSLSDYVGQRVRVAFVNNSRDCSRLYVDDIFEGVNMSAMLKVLTPKLWAVEGNVPVIVSAYTDDADPVSDYTIGLEYDGQLFTQHFTQPISAAEPLTLTLDEHLPLGFHEAMDYSVWIEAGGQRYNVDTNIRSYPRHTVCEEGTGTWCGYCVRGHVMLDSIRHHYSDRLIGVAAHSGDVMDCGYANAINNYTNGQMSGYPCGDVARQGSCNPSDFINNGLYVHNSEPVYVAMQTAVKLNKNARTVETDTRLWFAEGESSADYRLAFVVLESDIHQPGNDSYRQHNSYANNAHGPMGGYESKPEWVPSEEMWYHDVVRQWEDDVKGVSGSVPTTFEADEELQYSRTISLSKDILDDANTELVVMLIDQKSGRIVNAIRVPIGDNMKPVEEEPEPYERRVLIEEFTTEDCANCPRDSRRLQQTLAKTEYAGRAFALCHHAGYHEDRYTQSIDRTLLAFYNDGGQTYAPAFMIDRMPYFQSLQYGRTCCVTGLTSDDDLSWALDEELLLPTNATVDITDVTYDADLRKVSVTVSGECNTAYDTNDSRLSIFLVEDSVATTTQNGAGGTYLHHHLIRAYDNLAYGEQVRWRNGKMGKQMTFAVDDEWNVGHLRVLAVLLHYDSNNILNCPVDNCDQKDVVGGATTGIVPHVALPTQQTDQVYDLQGRRIHSTLNSQPSTLRKGIYIVNGKKILK